MAVPFSVPQIVPLGVGFLCLVGLSIRPVVRAAAPEPPLPRAPVATDVRSTARDLELTLESRAVLLKARVFGSHVPGVDVRHRVATLFGLIPSAELARRAEELLRQIPGLIEVRNELQIDPSNQPLTKSFAPPSVERPGSIDATLGGPFQAPAALVVRPTEHGPTPGQGLPWRPSGSAAVVAAAPPTPSLETNTPRYVAQDSPAPLPPLPNTDSGWRPQRGAREERPAAIASDLQRPAAVLLPPVRPEAGVALAEAVECLRLQDERFRRIRAEVDGAQVYLHGNVLRWEDLFAFAKAVSLLPTVERVILPEIHADLPTSK